MSGDWDHLTKDFWYKRIWWKSFRRFLL